VTFKDRTRQLQQYRRNLAQRQFHRRNGQLNRVVPAAVASLACFAATMSLAAPPQLYKQRFYESPARADPDDLLLIAGYGFTAGDQVIYRAIADTTQTLQPPSELPVRSTADLGFADVVSMQDVPYSLTIKLPQMLRENQSYALWVHTPGGEWSDPVMVNDARPLWFSPAYGYATDSLATLPRELKIVGRNLQPSADRATQIRLIGPRQYLATSISDGKSSASIDHYVARFPLPRSLAPGDYRVQFTRDGVSWIEVAEQTFEVRPDSAPAAEFSVSDPRFGGCAADDGADATACIVRAIAAADRAGGGAVVFGPGTWNLVNPNQPGVVASEGIVVPRGVQLRGAGSNLTRLHRHEEWNGIASTAAFVLQGKTLVTGFTFHDLQIYEPRDGTRPFIQLGEDFQRVAASPTKAAIPAIVSDVVITQNAFDKTNVALGGGGLPIRRLYVTFNTFGAFNSAIELGGNQFNMTYKYRIDDSVIDYNVFKPGSKFDSIGKTGSIAGEFGAGRRVDFSGNTADGSSTDYLYSAQDPRGWRAAFFWNMNGNIEEQLVSQNTATCTGDKIGDGEAIAYDNNTNTFGFTAAAAVVGAASTSVAVSAALIARQHERDVPIDSYYVDHWIQVISGPGLGQARKIAAYSTDPATHLTRFKVAPAWDVVPTEASRIAVGREYWQVYTVDNLVDERQPLCQKSNRSRPAAGVIGMWAQSADSVIEGNHQYDSDGILVQQAYLVSEHPCVECAMESYFQSFLEIRANTIDGEYDWNTDCSASGIAIGAAAAPWGDPVPPTVGFGVRVSRNTVRHADAKSGGAIAQVATWYAGPAPNRWPLSDNLLIDHNSIERVDGPRAVAACVAGHSRIGINFPQEAIAWRTVLYANSCNDVSVPVGRGGVDTVRVCPSPVSSSCECPR
jgi:hypothetical protein